MAIMGTYIALLRGINVSGHRLIKMADLKRMCEEMGLAQVQTYIQSGNVLFTAGEEREALRRRIEQQIAAVFGFDVPVALRTPAELESVIARCPFAPAQLQAGESLYVSFLTEPAAPEGIGRLLATAAEPDQLGLVGEEVYLLYRQPSHKSKLTNSLLEKRLGVPATSRNWQTTCKLAALGKQLTEG